MNKKNPTGCKNGTGDQKNSPVANWLPKMAQATNNKFPVANWLPKNCTGDQN